MKQPSKGTGKQLKAERNWKGTYTCKKRLALDEFPVFVFVCLAFGCPRGTWKFLGSGSNPSPSL